MLKSIRNEKGLSQSQLAKLSGVSVRMIQYYEQGTKDINKAEALTIFYLSQALSCRMEDLIMKEVINLSGTKVDFETAVQLMDDDIREDIHAKLSPCSEQVFFTTYEKAHAEKYGDWELSKENPVW